MRFKLPIRFWKRSSAWFPLLGLFHTILLPAATPTWHYTTVAFFTNSTCVVTQEMLQGRAQLESQLKSWERYAAQMEQSDSEDSEPGLDQPPIISLPSASSSAAATNDLESRLRKMFSQQSRDTQVVTSRLERIEVLTNQVRSVSTLTFTSLVQFASHPLYAWVPYTLELRSARFEITNNLFRLTFTPSPTAGSVLGRLGESQRGPQQNLEWRLVFPGRLRESSFPNTNAQEAWVRIEPGNTATNEALIALLKQPLVFAADPAGLTLPEPLDTAVLARSARRGSVIEPDIAVTEASPGFVAEAQSLSINTTYRFPSISTNRGKAKSKAAVDGDPDAAEMMLMMGQTGDGVMIQGRLYPPRGRSIRSIDKLQLLRAVDDQGRAVASADKEKADHAAETSMGYYAGGSSSGGSAFFNLNLDLPEPDAQSIETLEAEAIVTTLGDWQTLMITNVQPDAKKEIPLDTLIAGARLVISKVETKPNSKVELRLTGPREIGLLEMKLRLGRRAVQNSNTMDTSPPAKGTNITRQVTIQSYDYNINRLSAQQPYSLELRFPRNTKRERVRIVLTALDLL